MSHQAGDKKVLYVESHIVWCCSGAFGVVHRCVEKATGRVFVAKFINTPYPLDKATVKNEINIMNQLHHPKLLQLKDAFEDRHEMILVLELWVKL